MNLKTKVIAAEVSNLTDARYFAAWGVDYMSYSIDESIEGFIGLDGIKEIIDWVEGPINLGYLSGLNIPVNIVDLYTQLKLKGVVCNPFIVSTEIRYLSPKIYREVVYQDDLEVTEDLLIIKLSDTPLTKAIERLSTLALHNEVYIDGINSISDLELLLEKVNPTGIVLRGGEEEKVGFKSYDELDVLFEYLEVDY